jgi:large subunit ribosomal protein L24
MKKFKKGDTVIIMKGRDRGKKGTVLKVLPDHRLVVEGINILKKAVRPTKKNLQGGIIDINHPISVGNLRLLCPETGKPSRVGYKLTKSGKERIAKVSGIVLDTK